MTEIKYKIECLLRHHENCTFECIKYNTKDKLFYVCNKILVEVKI